METSVGLSIYDSLMLKLYKKEVLEKIGSLTLADFNNDQGFGSVTFYTADPDYLNS